MRILIAGQTYAPALNGQSIFTVSLAEGLSRIGHEVMAMIPSTHQHGEQFELNGVTVQSIGSIHLEFLNPNVYLTLPFNPQVGRAFKSFKPQVVHVQDHYPISLDAIRAARWRKINVIGTNHFMPQNLAPYLPIPNVLKPSFEKLLWWWMLLTYNHLDVVTGPSRTAVTIMRRNGLDTPAYPVSCGVDLERFKPLPEAERAAMRQRYQLDPHKKIFMYVGRVDGEKRIDLVIRALKTLHRPDIQLVVAGKGAALSHLQALADQLGCGEQVRFTGFLPAADLPAMLNAVDFFVMPSEAELLSIASLEAMACGRPMLLARSQALPELVDQGANGYLFEPGSIADLARCMALLADHPQQWSRMGAASLKKVQSHNIENTLRSYEKLYDGLQSGAFAFPYPLSRRKQINRRIRRAISNLLD